MAAPMLDVKEVEELESELKKLEVLGITKKRDVNRIFEVLDWEEKELKKAVKFWSEGIINSSDLRKLFEIAITFMVRSKKRLEIFVAITAKKEGYLKHWNKLTKKLRQVAKLKYRLVALDKPKLANLMRQELKVYEDLDKRDEYLLYQSGLESQELRKKIVPKIIDLIYISTLNADYKKAMRNGINKIKALSWAVELRLQEAIKLLKDEDDDVKKMMMEIGA